MGWKCPIGNVGHADLVELADGSWYAVMLASRLIDGVSKNLGRETFICPVTWERDWPLFSPETGKMEWEYPAPASLPGKGPGGPLRPPGAGPGLVLLGTALPGLLGDPGLQAVPPVHPPGPCGAPAAHELRARPVMVNARKINMQYFSIKRIFILLKLLASGEKHQSWSTEKRHLQFG